MLSNQSAMQAVILSKPYDSSVNSMGLCLYKADGSPYPIPTKAAAQADSTATDVAGLKTDLNALLAKLRTAGILS